MTILGHDVNGRPLRAGDRIVSLIRGATGVLIRVEPDPRNWHPADTNCLEYLRDDGELRCADEKMLRRLDDLTDHQPSEYTFDSLMDHLKSGVPA
jgi:hypothetical protein